MKLLAGNNRTVVTSGHSPPHTGPASPTRSERSCPVRPFAPSAFTDFHATMASADSPVRLPDPGPPQVRTRWLPLRFAPLPPCGWPVSAAPRLPARPPHLPPRLNPRLRCVAPVRRIVAGLDRRFLFVGPPVSPSLPPTGRLPFPRPRRSFPREGGPALASSSSSFTQSCDGPPTGDFHPIYNAPMLGAHQVLLATS